MALSLFSCARTVFPDRAADPGQAPTAPGPWVRIRPPEPFGPGRDASGLRAGSRFLRGPPTPIVSSTRPQSHPSLGPRTAPRLASPGLLLRAVLLFGLLLVASSALFPGSALAQDPPPANDPSGSARLIYEGRQVASIGFSLRADGPRFALAPVAQVLGVELRIGPLGDAHTLIFEGQKVIVGPDSPSVVVISPDGTLHEELTRLEAPPIKTAFGLEVPLDFLELTFGDELGFEFDWSFRNLQLELRRRDLRQLSGSIKLVHQHRASTVEILFSESPRYRFETLPGAVEVRLVGDSLALDRPFSRPADPLVTNIVTSPTRIRIELMENARAFEPRLVPRGGSVSMVIDVLRQSSTPKRSTEETPDRPTVDPLTGGIRTIVIDPGHGGEETGAVGASGTLEKELTLVIARLLSTRLQQRMPVRVVLTRDSDVDLPLETRVAIANENKADLFISLHFNSYFGSRARGAETYFLSREASDQMAARSAEVENRSAGTEEGAGDGDLDLILWDLAQSYHLNESQRFASLVQEELNKALGLRDRGVRQAPFKVLMGANMPAVLVELGFLSNPDEEAKLQSPTYLAQLADALVRAVTRLETQLEARSARSDSDRGPSDGGGPGGER